MEIGGGQSEKGPVSPGLDIRLVGGRKEKRLEAASFLIVSLGGLDILYWGPRDMTPFC